MTVREFVDMRLRRRGLSVATIGATPGMELARQANRLFDKDDLDDVAIGLSHLVRLGEIDGLESIRLSLIHARESSENVLVGKDGTRENR